jgi:hypothetical protein
MRRDRGNDTRGDKGNDKGRQRGNDKATYAQRKMERGKEDNCTYTNFEDGSL